MYVFIWLYALIRIYALIWLYLREEEEEQMRQQQEQEQDECHSEGEEGGKESRGPWAAVSAAPAPVHTTSNENQNGISENSFNRIHELNVPD